MVKVNFSSCYQFIVIAILLACFAPTTTALKLLMVAPLPSPSHHVWATTLLKELLRKGHNVHFAGLYPVHFQEEMTGNLTTIVFEDVMKDSFTTDESTPSDWRKYGPVYTGYLTHDVSIFHCDKMIRTQGAKQLLDLTNHTQFDVIVQDVTMMQCFYGLWKVAKGKPAIVGYIPFALAPWVKDFVGGSNHGAGRPYCHASLAPPLNLWQRVQNTLYFLADDLVRHFYYMQIAQFIADEYVDEILEPLAEYEKRIDILLINSHPTFEPAVPLPPNAIEIGGLHAQATEPLKDPRIKSFLDGAEHGAIVISLGTNVSWKDFKRDKLETVVQALSKLKQRVLWKLETALPIDLPKNVMTVKWLPQASVLKHKNVKAIWTHGGLLSIQEAIWHGVPVISMPFFMDQHPNTELLVSKGVGVRLDFDKMTTVSVLKAFNEILNDARYSRNMKQLSKAFRDRPVPPMDLAIWYIEYAARNGGKYLESPIRQMGWLETSLFDVYLVISILAMISFYIVQLLLKFVFGYVLARATDKLKQS